MHGKETLKNFLPSLTNSIPISNSPMSQVKKKMFLDVTVKLLTSNITTDLYIKSTEKHQYLLFHRLI